MTDRKPAAPVRTALEAAEFGVFLTVAMALSNLVFDGGRSFSTELRRQARWAAVTVLAIYLVLWWLSRRQQKNEGASS